MENKSVNKWWIKFSFNRKRDGMFQIEWKTLIKLANTPRHIKCRNFYKWPLFQSVFIAPQNLALILRQQKTSFKHDNKNVTMNFLKLTKLLRNTKKTTIFRSKTTKVPPATPRSFLVHFLFRSAVMKW